MVGCAQTNEAQSDGQTHWMTRCEDSSDCGALSCICGVCTEACTANDECSTPEGLAAACQIAGEVLDGDACSDEARSARVCVPRCDEQSACDAIASDLTCSAQSLCTVDERALPPPDGGADASEPDAGEPDASEPDAGEPPPAALELACDGEGNLNGEGPFEIISDEVELEDELAVGPDGTIYVTGVHDTVRGSLLRLADGELESFGTEVWEVQIMKVAGPDVVVAMANGNEVTIATIDRATEERLNLAYEEAINAKGLAADDDAIYWIGESEQNPTRSQLWRSPRVPGESVVLVELDGSMDNLVLANGELFFFATVDGEFGVYHGPKDGSGELELLRVPEFVGGLYADDQSLFVTKVHGVDTLGNPIGDDLGVLRIDPVTLDSETVLDTAEAPLAFALGAQAMYWTTDRGRDPFEPDITLWRAPKDGSGTPQALATLEAFAGPLVEHDGALYVRATCRVGNGGQVKSYIVELPASDAAD